MHDAHQALALEFAFGRNGTAHERCFSTSRRVLQLQHAAPQVTACRVTQGAGLPSAPCVLCVNGLANIRKRGAALGLVCGGEVENDAGSVSLTVGEPGQASASGAGNLRRISCQAALEIDFTGSDATLEARRTHPAAPGREAALLIVWDRTGVVRRARRPPGGSALWLVSFTLQPPDSTEAPRSAARVKCSRSRGPGLSHTCQLH
jgi:hypothetical protein